MADYTWTDANVVEGSGATIEVVTAGAAVTRGEILYKDSGDNEYKLADASSGSGSAAKASVLAIALSDAGDGQKIAIAKGNEVEITYGATTFTKGDIVVASPTTAGQLAPSSDLGSGDFVTVVGIAKSDSVLLLKIHASGIAI